MDQDQAIQPAVISVPGNSITARARAGTGPRPLTPMCLMCGSEDSLVFTKYTESLTLPNGRVKPSHAWYCCTRCGRTRDHTVSAGWRPPGWFYCT